MRLVRNTYNIIYEKYTFNNNDNDTFYNNNNDTSNININEYRLNR